MAEIMTPEQATAYANSLMPDDSAPISRAAIYFAVRSGALEAARIGKGRGRIIISKANLLAWLKASPVPCDSTERRAVVPGAES